MFKFPFTNFHELNLDWVLSVVKQAKEVFDNGQSSINYAVNTADEAKEIATQAAEATIPDNSVSTAKLQDNAVTLSKIANRAITGLKIALNTITGDNIAESTITNYNIQNGSLLGVDLSDNTVTGDKIANGAIFTNKLYDGAVTLVKLAQEVKDVLYRSPCAVLTLTTGVSNINPGETAELTVAFDVPSDFPNYLALIPQYTSSGLPIVSVWITGSPNTAHVSVLNTRSTAVTNESATVKAIYQR